jgi:hypothetical protein
VYTSKTRVVKVITEKDFNKQGSRNVKRLFIFTAIILFFSVTTSNIFADAELQQSTIVKKPVFVGLVAPEEEQYLTGYSSDISRMVNSVTYDIPETKETVQVSMDNQGILALDTKNVASVTKETALKIVSLVCTSVECVKNVISLRLSPPNKTLMVEK